MSNADLDEVHVLYKRLMERSISTEEVRNADVLTRFKDLRSGQVWEHVPEQCVAAYTFHQYSRGLRLAISQADAWPIPISLRF